MPAEGADNYPYVVAVLDDKLRIIECATGIQWIVQRRNHRARQPWRGVAFCRTKEALLRCAGSGSATHPALLALPDRFPEQTVAARRAGRPPQEISASEGAPSTPSTRKSSVAAS